MVINFNSIMYSKKPWKILIGLLLVMDGYSTLFVILVFTVL